MVLLKRKEGGSGWLSTPCDAIEMLSKDAEGDMARCARRPNPMALTTADPKEGSAESQESVDGKGATHM